MAQAIKYIVDEIFVDKYNCIGCDEELQEKSKYGLCPDCLEKTQFIKDNICKKCGRLQTNEANFCLTCQSHHRNFDFVRSCVVYDGVAKDIVRGLKFGHKKYFGKYISAFLIDRFEEYFANIPIDFIIAVPLTKQRRKKRRYNQSEELALHLAKATGIKYLKNIVQKNVANQEQAKLKGKEREENVLGVYEVIDKEFVKGKNILVIDDVMTTGSTLSEIARILKKSKANEVYGLTFASTRYKVQGESLDYEGENNEN